MKKTILLLIAAVCWTVAGAAPERRMLEQNKMWVYTYHHFEDRETPDAEDRYYDESVWMSYYQLKGDTVIEDRQYMKAYRWDDRNWTPKLYAVFREDEEGRVYIYNSRTKQDALRIDLTMKNKYPDATAIPETIETNGQRFRRYRYENVSPDGSIYTMSYLCVEGVGYEGKGLIHGLFEPQPDCICDYEELAYVSGRDFLFPASAIRNSRLIELSPDEQKLVQSNNDFAFRLFRRMRGQESSLISPLSITYALGMLNNGAAGQTQQEINNTLGFGQAGAEGINAFCRKMLAEAGTLDPQTEALIANTIFVNEGLGYRLQDGFCDAAYTYYGAQPQNRDFGDGQTMDVINRWASDHTKGLIPEVLDVKTFNPTAISYLLNALYFKGMWSTPFDAERTVEEPFGDGPAVPMMHNYSSFEYAETDLYQAVNLPYGNGAYQMTVYLPREDKTVGDVLESLDGSNWQLSQHEWAHMSDVDLKLPRFETENRVDLVKVMSDLGMPLAFTPVADFPNFCNVPSYIGKMFQVAKLKLDEQGTEAAAVTVIQMEPTSIPSFHTFHANRPFLYVISETSTGAIFFIGQYTGGVKTKGPNSITPPLMAPRQQEDSPVYDLSGRRLNNVPARGLYIQDGKLWSK
ncbi:MAG: serpin family protein [Bacteroidaceae bacterium]|nr:serpin family protein [Bacteroidaceae bacterium]